MMEVKETRLPGVGTKFAMRTARGERLVAIVHLDGMREVSHTVGDQEAHTITLNDEEARQLGAILVGAVYRLRWQIELAFKRLKSLIRIDRIPTQTEAGGLSWLYPHLILAMLTDDICQEILASFPSGLC